MKLKIDENLPFEAATLFQAAGHNAATRFDEELVGASDSEIARAAQAEGRVLVTLDVDFADTQTYPPTDYSGIVVLRLGHEDKPRVLAVLRRVLAALADQDPSRQLWVVSQDRIRIRE